MLAKEKTKTIREELRKHGINSRQVSVTCSPCGYSDSITCKIKDLSVNIDTVREISEVFSQYERDISGDILEGGNTYVHVSYDWEILKIEQQKKLEQAKEIFLKHKNDCIRVN